MKALIFLYGTFMAVVSVGAGEFGIAAYDRLGNLTVSNAFTNGICSVLRAEEVSGPWNSFANFYTTNPTTSLRVETVARPAFFKALAIDLGKGRTGFTNLTESYSLLSTIAGAGGATTAGSNKWKAAFENG